MTSKPSPLADDPASGDGVPAPLNRARLKNYRAEAAWAIHRIEQDAMA
jgi:hypothetical protein